MKKIYSIVLMATALLIGTNVNAVEKVSTWSDLRTALQKGGQVELSADINELYDASTFQTIWIGAKDATTGKASLTEAAPSAILDMAGHNITITANSAVAINAFALTKGSLKITGTGTIEVTGTTETKSGIVYKEGSTTETETITYSTGYPTNSTNVFCVFGADDDNKVEPLTNPFSHLEIDENVTIKTKNGSVIAVDQLTENHAALKKTEIANKGYNTSGMAYGALVEVKGTLISEGADYYYISKKKLTDGRKCYGIKANGLLAKPDDAVLENYKQYVPYIHVFPSAVLKSDMRSDMAGSAAAYPSGYAQWLIEGTCDGASGVYISGGIINIHNATISSAASTYNEPEKGGHANGSGSALVVNSRFNYPGGVEVTISGDTKASATSGYAVEEIVNTTDTKVDSIKIVGGTFEGGEKGALTISEKSATEAAVVVAGGNVSGTANIGADGLAAYVSAQGDAHATIVDDGHGGTTLVISEGNAPAPQTEWTDIAELAEQVASPDVDWTGLTPGVIGDGNTATTVTLGELLMNAGTDATHLQQLTIMNKSTLKVNRLVMNAYARIIVEAGGKLIVEGTQGINAPVVENITLKNEEGKRSIFLFNPAVTSNRHPNATIELITKSWWEDVNTFQWENFGLPTHNALKSITCEKVAGNIVYEEIQRLDGKDWVSLGYIGGTYSIPVDQLNKPFAAYNIIAYRTRTEDAPKCVMTGELVGNVNAELDAYLKWTPFSNSYTANVNIFALLMSLKNNTHSIDGSALYVAEHGGLGSLVWNAKDYEDAEEEQLELAPMQAFLLCNEGAHSEVVSLNYANTVWTPATTSASSAPQRRRAANNNTAKLRVYVTNEQGVSDNVKLRETTSDSFTFEKYMNEDVNIYAISEKKAAIVTADNIENTYLGVSTVKGGKFTISFANVMGREFDLVDLETGARVAVAEGFEYNFTADAGYANDYRFKIVERHFAPTGIENTEAVKSANGIFTITGQYVGEMNVWNTLPAGVYVVNGEKRVK